MLANIGEDGRKMNFSTLSLYTASEAKLAKAWWDEERKTEEKEEVLHTFE